MKTKNNTLMRHLQDLRLSTFVTSLNEAEAMATEKGWSHLRLLEYLCEIEIEERERRRKQRLFKRSGLAYDKTLDTLKMQELPVKIQNKITALCDGGFVDRCENILVFGLPGRGKTHIVSAIGHQLIALGFKVLFIPTFKLVQQLLIAKKELCLEKELKKLDGFDVVILDDIGYIQQDHQEMDVLFTFLGERYERKPIMLTSNLVFSQWGKIFKDELTTSAAIDRVIHHSVILEVTTKKSYRLKTASKRS